MAKKQFKNKRYTANKPVIGQEIATSGDGQDITKGYTGALAYPQDVVLTGRGHGDLKLYEQVLSDEEVFSVFQQRQNAMVSREWKVDAASDEPQDVQAAEFIRDWIDSIGFDRICKLMHFGVFYGYAVAEMLYRINDDGKYVADIKVRNRRRFRFTPQGELRLLTRANLSPGIACPAPYFWHFCTGADHDDEPYGIGLAHWLYWPSMFKRNGIKFWLIFLEKFGMPTALGRYGNTATKDQQKKLLEAVRAIQADSGIIVPLDMPIELLSAGRSGTADYKSLWDTMNDTIRRVVLGQTSSSGGTPGKLGNDDLQEQVLDAIVKADADMICESFNRGPVAWLTKMNFATAKPPRVYRVFEESEDLNQKAVRDKTVAEMSGYRPTLAQIQADYGGEWEKAAQQPQTAQVPNSPTSGTKQADFAGTPEAGITTQMATLLSEDLQPVIDDWLNKIRHLTEQADSLEQLRDDLLRLMPEMDLQQYADAMAIALGAAHLSGKNAVIDEGRYE